MDPLFIKFLSIVISAAIGALLYFGAQEIGRYLLSSHRRADAKRQYLFMAARQEIMRKSPNLPSFLVDMDASKECDRWEKVKFMRFDDKLAALRAGYSSYDAHKAYRALGREALQTQAALRTMGDSLATR